MCRPLLLLFATVLIVNSAPILQPDDDEVAADKESLEMGDSSFHHLFKRKAPMVSLNSLTGNIKNLQASLTERRKRSAIPMSRNIRTKRQALYDPEAVEEELADLSDEDLEYLADVIDRLQEEEEETNQPYYGELGFGRPRRSYVPEPVQQPIILVEEPEPEPEMVYVVPTYQADDQFDDELPDDYDEEPIFVDERGVPDEDDEDLNSVLDEIELRDRIGELAESLNDRYSRY